MFVRYSGVGTNYTIQGPLRRYAFLLYNFRHCLFYFNIPVHNSSTILSCLKMFPLPQCIFQIVLPLLSKFWELIRIQKCQLLLILEATPPRLDSPPTLPLPSLSVPWQHHTVVQWGLRIPSVLGKMASLLLHVIPRPVLCHPYGPPRR